MPNDITRDRLATLRINRLHYPVTALGYGRRVGIWVQGCSIGCPGCVSQETWNPKEGFSMEIVALLASMREVSGGLLDGVTISGGEPFDQAAGLATLVAEIRSWEEELGHPLDILVYSGRPLAVLAERHRQLLDRLDALIPEPYRCDQPAEEDWRGSANQPLVHLSPLGADRYDEEYCRPGRRRLQLIVEDGRFWLIGIPGPGDLKRLEELCGQQGLCLHDMSWNRR